MNFSIKRFFIVVVILQLILFSSTFAYKKVKIFVLQPPKEVLVGVKRIAILDFKTAGASEAEKRIGSTQKLLYDIFSDLKDYKKGGSEMDYGTRFSDLLISALLKKDRGITKVKTGLFGLGSGKEGKSLLEGTFTNVYEVLERSQIMQIVEEQKLGASGMVAEDQAANLGNMLGVQALITGNVDYSHKDSEYKGQRTREKKKNGKKVKEKYTVNCKKRHVKVSVRAKIVNAETGQIIVSTEANKSYQKDHCSDQWGSLPSVDEMINNGLKELVPKIANYFSPYYKLMSFELEKIKTKKFKNHADKAAKLAEDLKIDEANFIYNKIYEQDAYNPKVIYNLGIMNECVGNFQEAYEFYEMAQQLKQEKRYKKAVDRTEKSANFSGTLAQMGVMIQKHDFTLSAEDKVEVIAKKVEIKGKREQRFNVFTSPDKTSEVVAKVPGGVRFTVLKKEGNWYLIKLLGGKQGYVHKDKVKLHK
jgi:tetratricopeptide (TPR) repeat protein